jgi:hypothetical protein
VNLLGERLEHGTGLTDSATEMLRDELREIVMDTPDIQKVVKRLEKERETYVHAANSIIIVAALIGTVTFTVFLTPPPGYLDTPSRNAYAFYICNSLSFFSAILTLVIGSSVTQPQFRRKYITVTMSLLRQLLIIAYNLLYFSLSFFMSTFLIAGHIVVQFKVYVKVTDIMAVVSSYTVLAIGFLLLQPVVSTRYNSYLVSLYCLTFSLLVITLLSLY